MSYFLKINGRVIEFVDGFLSSHEFKWFDVSASGNTVSGWCLSNYVRYLVWLHSIFIIQLCSHGMPERVKNSVSAIGIIPNIAVVFIQVSSTKPLRKLLSVSISLSSQIRKNTFTT
jgi:hypothetical protein